MKFISIVIVLFLIFSCREQSTTNILSEIKIANGQMPAIAKDGKQNIHVVYGKGDSIMYTSSTDRCNSFSTPQLVDTSLQALQFFFN
ncbi:MAG: hypothetical protein ACR2FN_11810 [Chitinophagaceae bacterium]